MPLVVILGRCGPAPATFSHPEAKELGQLPGADIHAKPEGAAPDPVSAVWLEESANRLTTKKVRRIEGLTKCAPTGKPRCLINRYLASPVTLHNEGSGSVGVACSRYIMYGRLQVKDGSDRGRLSVMKRCLPAARSRLPYYGEVAIYSPRQPTLHHVG